MLSTVGERNTSGSGSLMRLTAISFRFLHRDIYIDVKPEFDDKSDTVIKVSVNMKSRFTVLFQDGRNSSMIPSLSDGQYYDARFVPGQRWIRSRSTALTPAKDC